MKKAISYIRFSTIAQGDKGRDSTIRQKRALEDALKKWNLELDQQFLDAGKSGYKGRHIQKGGAMFELRELAKAGKLAGKVLVVEDWDRVGRLKPMDAIRLLLDILDNGVDMVVGDYGGEYFSGASINDNYDDFSFAVREMARGHSESKRKSDMARNKWQSRMESLASGQSVALNNYPFWVGMERDAMGRCTGKQYQKKEMVKLVKEIFALYLSGIGTQKIAGILNQKGIPTPLFNNGKRAESERGWYQGRVLRLIKDRAVLGFYQDKRNGTEYQAFEPIISESDFYRANNKRKERVYFAGRRSEKVNPFANLTKCAKCGGAVSPHGSKSKQGKTYAYLQCRYPHDHDCGKGGIAVEMFEKSFWGFLMHIDDLQLGEVQSNEPLKSIGVQGRIDALETKLAVQHAALDALQDPTQAPSIGQKIAKLETEKAALMAELRDCETVERGSVKVDGDFVNRLHSFLDCGKLDEPATRLQMQEALRAVVDKISMDTMKKSYAVTFKNTPKLFKVQFQDKGKAGGIVGWTKSIIVKTPATKTQGGPVPPTLTAEGRAAMKKHIADNKKTVRKATKGKQRESN